MKHKYIFLILSFTLIVIVLILIITIGDLSSSYQQIILNCIISIVSAVIGSLIGLPTAKSAYEESRATHVDDDIDIVNTENKLLNKSIYKFINLEGQIDIFIFDDEKASRLNNKYNINNYGELYSNCNLYLSEIKNIDNDVLSSNQNIYSLLNKLSKYEKKEQNKINKITKDVRCHFNNYETYKNKLLNDSVAVKFINKINKHKCNINDKVTNYSIGGVLTPFAEGLQHMDNELNDIVKEIINSNLFK